MKRMLKTAMAALIALGFGTASAATGAVTGYSVLDGGTNANLNKWMPPTTTGVPGSVNTSDGQVTDVLTGTFHVGGVAACDGCHVMHNASGGTARSAKLAPWTNAVPAFLLQGSDQSSTCLICHGGTWTDGKPYIIANAGSGALVSGMNYSPGGDFGWLVKGIDKATDVQDRRGHNVAASDYSIYVDTKLTVAPGGTFVGGPDTAQFACSNCHDPHGKFRMQATTGSSWEWNNGTANGAQPIVSSGSYGNKPVAGQAIGAYRLLAGRGYAPASNPMFPFVNNPPVAVAPTAYNKTETHGLAGQVLVAYGSGMSEWCQNCHTNIHMDTYVSGAMGASGLRHPAGQGALLKPGQYNVYNQYISSGNIATTNDNRYYNTLVPFENAKKITYDGTVGNVGDFDVLKSAAANGASATTIFTASADSNVMCLSCHRAHASAFSSMVRWNPDDTFITDGSLYVNTQNRDADTLKAGYYGRDPSADMGAFQRSLCNKCHGKD